MFWAALLVCSEANFCKCCINLLEFFEVVVIKVLESFEVYYPLCELVSIALCCDSFTEFCDFLLLMAVHSSHHELHRWCNSIAKENVRVKVDPQKTVISFDRCWDAEGAYPRMDKGRCYPWASGYEIDSIASALLSCRFSCSRVLVVVEIQEVGFLEQARYVCLWVIDGVVGVHADNDFFIVVSPGVDLTYKVSGENGSGFGIDDTLCLKYSYLLCCTSLQCCVKFLVTNSITRYNYQAFVVFSNKFEIRPATEVGVLAKFEHSACPLVQSEDHGSAGFEPVLRFFLAC